MPGEDDRWLETLEGEYDPERMEAGLARLLAVLRNERPRQRSGRYITGYERRMLWAFIAEAATRWEQDGLSGPEVEAANSYLLETLADWRVP